MRNRCIAPCACVGCKSRSWSGAGLLRSRSWGFDSGHRAFKAFFRMSPTSFVWISVRFSVCDISLLDCTALSVVLVQSPCSCLHGRDLRPTCVDCRLDADQDVPETKQRKIVCGMQPLCWLSVLNSVLLAVLVMLVIVRVVTPDQEIGVFPSGCSKSLPIGCSRIAEEHPQRDEGQDPVALTSPATVVAQAVKEWAMSRRGHLLDFNHGEAGIFLHFRFLSSLWGFPDDFLVLVRCTAEVRQKERDACRICISSLVI